VQNNYRLFKLFGEHSDAEHKCLPKKTTTRYQPYWAKVYYF